MLSRWIVDFPADESLPPFVSDDGYCIQYTDDSGNLAGWIGYVGPAPARTGVPTCLIDVECSPAVFALMQADPRYELVEVLNG